MSSRPQLNLIQFLILILSFAPMYNQQQQLSNPVPPQQGTGGVIIPFEPTRKMMRQEQPPPFHLAVWDDQGKICILAKVDASFTITYATKYGDQQMIDRLTSDATVHGRCESFLDENPVMDIKWRGGFTFRLIFGKVTIYKLF